ncbi:signal peptidase II [Phenylobacterium sp. J367]|uniref:signal peptidase II n=1 Tax=Phenylobacterium sp. J367 TaxID=2898435 RepID=UPI002151F707|nr:signal peptidase II [Phenylobacterium sp. J367]MCR5877854.1 signal peptidase II [Phenylobacterium sp. J367]
MKLPKLAGLAYGLAALTIVLDQLSKYWILEIFQLPARGSVPVGGPLALTMVWNQGVSFGLLRADQDIMRWALVLFAVGVSVVLAIWARKAGRPLLAAALGLIMGGAVGNVIDRIRFGAVADFIDVSALHFPWIFNVADAAINIGIALLLLDMIRGEKGQTSADPTKDAA